MKTVHCLWNGITLCRLAGIPIEWPKGQIWSPKTEWPPDTEALIANGAVLCKECDHVFKNGNTQNMPEKPMTDHAKLQQELKDSAARRLVGDTDYDLDAVDPSGQDRRRRSSDTFTPALSPELAAMKTAHDTMSEIGPEERARVLAYVLQKFQQDHDSYPGLADQFWTVAGELGNGQR